MNPLLLAEKTRLLGIVSSRATTCHLLARVGDTPLALRKPIRSASCSSVGQPANASVNEALQRCARRFLVSRLG